jgi:hypothetical protein
MIDRQRRRAKEGTIEPTVLILDDCMYEGRKMLKNTALRQLFYNGRHLKITLLLTSQYLLDLPPEIRCNVDLLFVLKDNVIGSRLKLYNHFFGMFPTFSSFSSTMDATTNNFEALCLDNRSRSNDVSECAFYYKAKERGDFKMCRSDTWRWHKKNYNNDHFVGVGGASSGAETVVIKKKR